jgi:Flp pilus assembly protein TadG
MVHGRRERAVKRLRSAHTDERGVIAVLLALMLVLMLGIVALVVDLGNARQERRAAQAGADAAVLAAAEAIEWYGGNFTGSAAQWTAVVAQVKAYAGANFNTASSAWVGCADPGALTYRPDWAQSNACISADFASWPVVQSGETSIGLHVRVHLPGKSYPNLFAGVLGSKSLTVQASANAAVIRTHSVISTTTQGVGGPCAICLLGNGLSLDGQNGDITVTGGNVTVNSTAGTASSLLPNGHVKITTVGSAIGGPKAPGNFSGNGYSPTPTILAPVVDPLAAVAQCGALSTCPTTAGANGTQKGATLSPGIYSTISGSHTLNPGIYVVTGGVSLSGNDLLSGSGVMLYLACSGYPAPCAPSAAGAAITAVGNGALHLSPPTAAQCNTQSSVCPYVGIMLFADRENTATSTFRGNGTNENGGYYGSYGTIYMKSGTLDLRGNGFTLASQIITGSLTMKGNPSGITVAYDLAYNAPETHPITTTADAYSYDNNGLSG